MFGAGAVLLGFLVLAVATGYGSLNRVSFHACAINTIFAVLTTIQAGGGCGVCDFPVAVGEEGERAGLWVCELMCVSERCVGWEPLWAEGGSWVRAYPMRSNSPIPRLPAL